MKKRLAFIDWMKAMGMFAIVLGHFFPPTIQYLTYAFSVQLFFFVSGFLFKKCPDPKNFWHKNMQGLIVPYFVLGGVNLFYTMMRTLDVDTILCSMIGLCLGISNVDNHGGCGGLWFVMTLLLLKVIFQYISLTKVTLLVLAMFPMIFIYRNAIIGSPYEYWGLCLGSIFVAYPFFLVGYLLSCLSYHKIFLLSSYLERKYRALSCLLGVAVLILLYVISPTNGVVYMIYGGFGNQFYLFMLYSLIGIIGVYLLAIAFSRSRCTKWVQIISIGNIVILAFQGYFIERIAPRLETLTSGKNALYEYGSVIASIMIMLLFIPIVSWCQRYVPIVVGKRRYINKECIWKNVKEILR